MVSQVSKSAPERVFVWEGQDRLGKRLQGELRASAESQVKSTLRRQGVIVTKVTLRKASWLTRPIKAQEITVFTRQLATMLKTGVPLLQAFDIVTQGNARAGALFAAIRHDVETGSSLSAAFRQHPRYFDNLYCNLVATGESAGALDTLLGRVAAYLEKTQAIKSKIKSALLYPVAVLLVAVAVTAVILIFVVPSFQEVFANSGASLPAPTLFVMAASAFLVAYWHVVLATLGLTSYAFWRLHKASAALQLLTDKLVLHIPIFGDLIAKSCVARWTRTLSTLFAAGVPMVEALDAVAGATGNGVYAQATMQIKHDISTGTGLTAAMDQSGIFPRMVLQMCASGEESGAIDNMLDKAADFYEAEVDNTVAGISSLIEPIVIVVLGCLIGGIVVAMYLPIFNIAQVV